MSRDKLLAEYLQDISLEADFWGRSNCMLFVARWVGIVRPSYDPSPWIGAHRSMADAARDILKAGGMAKMFEREAAKAGLAEIAPEEAELGDVGMFEVKDAAAVIGVDIPELSAGGKRTLYPGCIRTARHWAVRGGDGVGRVLAEGGRMQPIRVWRV